MQYWQNNLNADPRNPSENVLENSLRRIGREDIIYKAIFNINQIEEQIKPEVKETLYADINRQDHRSNVHTYQPFEQPTEDNEEMEQEPEIVQLEEPVPIRYEDNENRYQHSPQLVELTEGFTIEQHPRQPSTGDLLEESHPHYEEFSTSQPHVQQHYQNYGDRIEEDLLGRRSESPTGFVLEENVAPEQASHQQPKSRQGKRNRRRKK